MRRLLALLLASSLAGCASQRDFAVGGQVADVGSTAVGLAAGASEANPLGILALGAKVVMYDRISKAPTEEQPALWRIYGAFGWGATANNVCVIAAIASGGVAAAVCPLIGLAAGVSIWQADEVKHNRAEFDALCKQAKEQNEQIVCTWYD